MSFRRNRHAKAHACLTIVLLFILGVRMAGAESTAQDALSSFTMEQLVNLDVSSVARREQKLYKTPAAVYVVTRDDIRRSGAENIAEVLRMVPGVQVAQTQANRWAVGTRGFNSVLADKLLVMIDGRSIYNSVFSETYWDMNEIPLDTIERIEVVRGPGATMWGANAVNGVINIITFSAQKTLGKSVTLSEGSLARGAEVRYGAEWKSDLNYRIYAKDQFQHALEWTDGSSAHDAGRAMRFGARGDFTHGARDTFTMQGDYYRGNEDQQEYNYQFMPVQDKVYNFGGFVMAHWERRLSSSDFALQIYYGSQNRRERLYDEHEGAIDIDFQHHIQPRGRHELTWGAEARRSHDHLHGPVAMFHDKHQILLYSSFLQDEISLLPDKVVLTVGSKMLWNSFTHFEVQPSVRLLWTPDASHSFWAAVSRPVRTPSVFDRDVNVQLPAYSTQPIPVKINLEGNPHIKSEDVLSFEAGYRQKIGPQFSIDLAGYFMRYTGLKADVTGTPTLVFQPGPTIVIPAIFSNGASAKTQGVEAVAYWNPRSTLHLTGSYTWLQFRATTNAANITPDDHWNTPRNSVTARGAWDFSRHWTVDAALYSLSQTSIVPGNFPTTPVPAYHRVDLGLAYTLHETLTFRAGIRNLQQDRHIEINQQKGYLYSLDIPRSAFVKLDWSF